MRPYRKILIVENRLTQAAYSLQKTLSIFGFSLDIDSECRNMTQQDYEAVIFLSNSGYNSDGILNDLHVILPLFQNSYQGRIIIISRTSSLSSDKKLNRYLDSGINVLTFPLNLPSVIEILCKKNDEKERLQRLSCCRGILAFFPGINLYNGLVKLKKWYTVQKIDQLIERSIGQQDISRLEHDLSNLAPWMDNIKKWHLNPPPLFVEDVPSNMGVLIIDDEKSWADRIKEVIDSASLGKWKTDWVVDGKKALGRVKNYLESKGDFFPIDIILLDLQFGKKTNEGIEILKDIRNISKNIPINILTVQRGSSSKLFDYMGKGASNFSSKIELENIPAHIAGTVRLFSFPRIDDRLPGISLTEDERYILSHLFRSNHKIILEKCISKGNNKEKRIIQVRRFGMLENELAEQHPVIVKIGPAFQIKREYENYEKYISPFLPLHSLKIDRYLIHGNIAAVSYALLDKQASKGNLKNVTTLRERINQIELTGIADNICDCFSYLIKNDIGPAWYQNALLPKNEKGRVFDFYALKMPVIFNFANVERDARSVSEIHLCDFPRVRTGQVIKITGRLDHNKNNIFNVDSLYKVKLDPELIEKHSGQLGNRVSITGKVTQTLTDLIGKEWSLAIQNYEKHAQVDDLREIQSIDIKFNPIKHLWNILFRPLGGNISIVHGDFHIDNVFFDWEKNTGWLIDYGSTYLSHVCFDFIRLEVDIRTRILSGIFQKENGTIKDMILFEKSLPPFDYPLLILNPELHRKLKPQQQIIRTIRNLARTYLSKKNEWQEYFQGLFCYCLNTFKFQQEKKTYYPYSRSLPMACAVTSYSLGIIAQASKKYIKAVIFDLWDTLLEGSGNPVTRFLKDKIKKAELEIIKDKLLTTRLDKDECIELVAQYYPPFDKETLYQLITENEIVFRPGALELIKDLYRCGIKLGILSNDWALENRYVIDLFHQNSLMECFDSMVFSFEANMKKPDKEIFQKILRELKVEPDEILMVGDSEKNDIVPANILGMRTFYIKQHSMLKSVWTNIQNYF
jgi:HAD superfamily hydrolase (TIGR01662 family)